MPRTATPKDEESAGSGTAKVLGGNLRALMQAHSDLGSNPKLAKKTGLSTSTISRLLNGQVDATLATIDKLAEVFHVTPWQLLVPNIEPGNLPALLPITPAERKLHERLRELMDEMKER
jgi:transcriptional regulator with XRE-family HTH domain